jgi:hypothetical protein
MLYSPKCLEEVFYEVRRYGVLESRIALTLPVAEGRGPFGKGILHLRLERSKEEAMMDRERPSASDSEEKIPEAWIGQEVMIETTEALSSDLRAAAPVYLEDVNDRGLVMLVTRHRDQSQFSRYFYPWSVVGWIRLAEEDEQEDPAARGSS